MNLLRPFRRRGPGRRQALRAWLAAVVAAGAPWRAWGRAVPGEAATGGGGESPWRPDHIVVVILENLSAFDATDNQRARGDAPVYAATSDWRFFNDLALQGARFTDAHFGRTPYGSALPTRSSQPNYLFLFSGHHQGVLPAWFEDERSPYLGTALFDRQGRPLVGNREAHVGVANNQIPDAWLPFTAPNLGAAVMQGGGSFLSFSESLPYPSWNCGTDASTVPCNASFAFTDDYRRKHNPVVNWTDVLAPTSKRGTFGDLSDNVLPVSVNLGFEPTVDPVLKRRFRGFSKDEKGRPLPFDHLPTVSIVVPNEQHDAHSNTAKVADDWLRANLADYARWARTHNSLLIVTFDEDGSTDRSRGDAYVTGTHRIPTFFYGAKVKAGSFTRRIDHLNVLATILWLTGSLARFKAQFHAYHQVVDGSGSEAEKEYLNLVPITSVFELGEVKPAAPRASRGSS